MQKKTVYLAGKITGDPFYRSKFYEAQKKLEEGGFIVVNPALLPSEGFTWEAYMRMAGAMLDECAEVCFLPDWKESKGAQREFDEAFVQEMIVAILKRWDVASGNLNLELILSEEEKEKFQQFVATKYKELLDKGLEIKVGDHTDAFVIQPKDGGYQVAFSEKLFETFFNQYMRSFTKSLLYK